MLVRILGVLDLIMFGIGVIVGIGIFVLMGVVVVKYFGLVIILLFVIVVLVCVFVVFCYVEFVFLVFVLGSVYMYIYVTMGEVFVFLIGWDLMLEYLFVIFVVVNGWFVYF